MTEDRTQADATGRVDALEARIEALLGVVAAQTARIETLEDRLAARATPAAGEIGVAEAVPAPRGRAEDGPASAVTAEDHRMDRRKLLAGGGIAAAAAAAGVLASGTPAAAANGSALTLGVTTNASTLTTKLTSSDPNSAPGVHIVHTGGGPGLQVEGASTVPTILGGAEAGTGVQGSATSGTGVYGVADAGDGVYGQSAGGSGVYGVSTTGVGTYGVSGSGSGMAGVSNSGDGVYAQSESGRGVYGLSNTGKGIWGTSYADVGVFGEGLIHGVRGQATDGEGVYGRSTNSAGLYGSSDVGSAVYAEGADGPGLTSISNYANLVLGGDPARKAPATDTVAHFAGDVVTDGAGNLWVCTAAGTPGTWRKVAGPASAGSFHLLPTAVRIYDSRAGFNPSTGPKTPLTGNTPRTLSVTNNNSGVPLGATAVSFTLLLLNASTAGGNFTIWATGATRPAANAMVWGGTAGRFASTAVSRVSADGKVNVAASASADLALDVVGYYL